MLAQKLMSAMAGGEEKLYVDDVFSAFTYTGNGSTQTITNGIDLAGKGGLVWSKSRNAAQDHYLTDTARGARQILSSNTTTGSLTASVDYAAALSNGYSIDGTAGGVNTASNTYVSWTFRKSPKFFDVVTWTATSADQLIPHALGTVPGMVIAKSTSNSANWLVWHRGSGGGMVGLSLNLTNAAYFNNTGGVSSTATHMRTGDLADANLNGIVPGQTYVAYLFAHDPGADGIIQCGSFTTDASGNATVNLGWEPQYILSKVSSAAGWDWHVADTSRGLLASGISNVLYPNTSGAEAGSSRPQINATGFSLTGQNISTTHIYLAIRRPNKPPTTGTQVYNAIARTGTSAAATVTGVGFAPDAVFSAQRSAGTFGFHDKLRGAGKLLVPFGTNAEISTTDALLAYTPDGISLGADVSNWYINSANSLITHFFKRTPGVFDVVCYTGTGSVTTVAHSLGVAPEFIITKRRDVTGSWRVYCAYISAPQNNYLTLESTAAPATASGIWPSTSSSTFGLAAGYDNNNSGGTFVSYLFATKAGISKVGSYTGNGTTQTINCGFTTGARFFLVKSTSTTGDWWVYDTTRGIVSSTDFTLTLNSTAAEVTSADAVDPASVGIVVNQEATCSINASGVSYIYLAYA